MLVMASLLCRLTWCDGVRCLARVMTHVASLLCSLVELVAWSTSLALLRLMKKYSRDVIIIHGARRRELPLPQKPFQKVWTKMEGKGSVHNLPWRKLDRWVNLYCNPTQLIDLVLRSLVLLLSAAATFEVTSEEVRGEYSLLHYFISLK